MTFYLHEASSQTFNQRGIPAAGITAANGGVYCEVAVNRVLRECIDYQYKDYKNARQYASALSAYQSQISSLQSALSSTNSQYSQANTAKLTAENRCRVLESDLQIKNNQLAALEQQNTTLLKTQAALQQQIQNQAQVKQQAASDIAELKQALQSKQAVKDLTCSKYAHLECQKELLKSEKKDTELRITHIEKDHSLEMQRMCDQHVQEIIKLYRKIQTALHAQTTSVSSTEDY